ncbi:WD40/YVTN/BNR-like repeat-containing protein [Polaromonas glacialis]|uniref:WD40/YVTN/BNR-like repeat-containing protein n=1 Tax=Polaromonas glacialis TaxID=866564 RepID=UPI000496D432|nr:YCF48-related protein [Polaromonas glacialis]
MAVLMALGAAQAFAPRHTPPLAATRLAVERMHLNTLVASKAGLVTGGELGTLLYSTNQGKDWQRAKVSADRQALINQISFAPDGLHGMAVGHEGWILRTSDGGLSWQEVAFDEKNGEPLMSVARLPSGVWIAVGAFGRALQSDDQGDHWTRLALPGAGVEDKHLNRIVGSADGQRWLIVGERGLVLHSGDAGQSWSVIEPFYNGSLYNAMPLPNGGWLAYGMRGNIFHTDGDQGPWSRSDIPVQASFFGHAMTADGRLMLVGQGSVIATSTDGGRHFSLSRAQGRASLTDLLLLPDGQGLLASDAGLQAFSSVPKAVTTPSSGVAQ